MIVYAGQKWARLKEEYLHSEWTSDTNILISGGKGGDITTRTRNFYLFIHF